MLTDELKNLLATDPERVVIIVGAGVTIGALRGSEYEAQASWRGLLTSGLRCCEETYALSPAEAAHLGGLLDSDRTDLWITVAEAVASALKAPAGGEFRRWLRATVGRFASVVRERAVLDALADLARRGALLATVNYDDLLEEATGLSPVTWLDSARVERVLHGEERAVLHLHGHWAAPESVVLGVRSYEDVVRDAHARSVLGTLRMQRVLVFVGHGAGLADPNWGSFLRWTGAVHAASEYRHYRLVRAAERAQVQAEHPPEQRIFALPYGDAHGDLAPFLRGLAPGSGAPSTAPREDKGRAPGAGTPPQEEPGDDVVLHLIVGEEHYKKASRVNIRAQLRLRGRTVVRFCEYILPIADISRMEARDWHAVARGLEELVARADAAAERHRGPVRLVIAGMAPLPAFSYLGLTMARNKHDIAVLNHRRGTTEWDLVTLQHTRGRGGRDQFTVKSPQDSQHRPGKVVLSLRCSEEFKYAQVWARALVEDEGDDLLCSYEVYRELSQWQDSLVADDIGTVIGHVETAMAVFTEKCPGHHGLVLAIGGPSWVGFWVAHRLTATVTGRIDLANYLRAEPEVRSQPAYVPALRWPMRSAPWVAGKLRLLILVAEPDDAAGMAALREYEAIRTAIVEVRGPDSVEIFVRGAVRPGQIQRILAEVRPHVLHVSVHGSEKKDGRMLFEGEDGNGRPLAATTFIEMLRASADSLVVVVASVCHWGPYAQPLTKLAKFVISTDAELPYQAAITFAGSFYRGVARGEPLGPAFRRARNDALAEYPAKGVERLAPSHAGEVDPEQMVLMSPRRRR